jgi:hypothetical protein
MATLSSLLRTACAGAVIFAGTSGALAQDVDAALERLRALLAEQAIDIDWEEAEIDGNNATLRGVSVGDPEGMEPIGDVFVNGISEIDDGYRIAALSLPHYAFGDDEIALTIDGVLFEGIVLPDEGAGAEYGGFFFYERAAMAELHLSMEDTDVFTLDGLDISVTPAANGEPMRFSGVADSFTADLTVVDDEEAAETIRRLGYETLSGAFATEGSWQPEDGRLILDRYDLTVADGGTFGFAFDIDGYTPDFIRSLAELQRSMAEGGDETAGGMAVLGLLQQLSLHGADIYFHDDSLTGRVLEVFAEDQNMRPQDVVNQTKAILPFLLAQMNAPELASMITDAVSDYLDDPQSLRISARPAQPLPFALLMAGAMASPQALVEQVGLEIVANE